MGAHRRNREIHFNQAFAGGGDHGIYDLRLPISD
jgi:hypothetical protein